MKEKNRKIGKKYYIFSLLCKYKNGYLSISFKINILIITR